MSTSGHVLISLEERHALNIFAGSKQVELRRRTMHVEPGTVVWIYVKQPVGCVVGHAVVKATHSLSPRQVWGKFGSRSGLRRQEFFAYFEDVARAFVLELRDARRLEEAITLETLRAVSSSFHPPQFFTRLTPETALARVLARSKFSTLAQIR
ncbi:hypothetical protein Rmet_3367 [Cupriavidus metallidurans CH34]|uniref:Uncharacterized protein n=1 Tax=Cupriavidus metallidurans (strain ATCC 43123 / DSM 2839 / NBRC 102507 / CH34) TaxID=266264 RepID=Q1LHY7_CUPMC|nr:hypothetical protein Rmet_3367 [Cupriavidus metallidurans CH34]